MSNHNPFEAPAAPSQGKMTFGTLRIITNRVNLETGAILTVSDLGIDPDPDSHLNKITDDNGNLKEFRGKRATPNGKSTHVITVITTRAKQGHMYNAARDFMYFDNDVCQRAAMPALKKHFGSQLKGIVGKTAEVQAEVVEIKEKDKKGKIDPMTGEVRIYARQAFKVVKVFKTADEREAASDAFYSQFSQTSDEIADEIPGFDAEIDAPVPGIDKPVGMTKPAAEALLPTLWAASGQDKAKFTAQLEGMPVVLEAVGGINAPEIQAYLI